MGVKFQWTLAQALGVDTVPNDLVGKDLDQKKEKLDNALKAWGLTEADLQDVKLYGVEIQVDKTEKKIKVPDGSITDHLHRSKRLPKDRISGYQKFRRSLS